MLLNVVDLTFRAADQSATARFGGILADALKPGDVVSLNGPLGAGKTRLVQVVAAALGCRRQMVNSPTFVLIQEYDGRLPLYHVDAYRLKDSDEFLEIGGEELLESDGVCLIEWADRIADVLPRDLLRIEITPTGETEREFKITAAGPRSRTIVEALKAEHH
ncbi:MAG: tRNA (adenosine(37)-N6)-threonylcarbamoyltransferase complex ATPase subunit type 1 TsaE [Planctomycetota bacterium]|nr:MAG: tRNA (adenosine(37)-N6)-threonylcarbamoyltransferase complex ATPase subunit type 1 TsaE [Planctomycetota bacterium]REJ97218.1 MAG: tRNA (adenosine(37)-N6)-threonylcarbamoyltransferase complex ATPase subunit type 1 TsaE [Planctomycetota bacterium]REK30332.1 MAG: tRNA (adenosine(37)-N6)-threonylcarbamoyltransferase complex ATPase subunit type 1 TsaE [Planctomycetota bacterium]REK31517.1 MAG: tRNA (adenosine(37)-N6)-threonylcarbamoyltransferase complex ATPase subunit type 1 TsaE [Planctomyc